MFTLPLDVLTSAMCSQTRLFSHVWFYKIALLQSLITPQHFFLNSNLISIKFIDFSISSNLYELDRSSRTTSLHIEQAYLPTPQHPIIPIKTHSMFNSLLPKTPPQLPMAFMGNSLPSFPLITFDTFYFSPFRFPRIPCAFYLSFVSPGDR